MLDLILTNKEGLVGNVKLRGSLGCSDHEMMEFKILRAARKVHSKLTVLHFRRAGFGLFRDLSGRVPWDKALRGREAKKAGWYSRITSSKLRSNVTQKSESQAKSKEGWVKAQGAAGETQAKKGSLPKLEARTSSLGGIQRNCLSSQGSG